MTSKTTSTTLSQSLSHSKKVSPPAATERGAGTKQHGQSSNINSHHGGKSEAKFRKKVRKHRGALSFLSGIRWYKWGMTTLVEFGKETSLHGWKFAVQSRGVVHKIIWILLIFTGLGLAIYQIVEKVQSFLAMPLSVNIEISYNETLTFPAVTICSTLEAKVSWLMENQELLPRVDEMFRKALPTVDPNYDDKHLQNLNLDLNGFLRKSQLSPKELFLWCRTPKGKACEEEHFVSIWTDSGLCHTINVATDYRTAGPDRTLELIIDAGTYEQIPTFPSAGIRMSVHLPNQMPLMSDASDVAPGAYTVIGLSVQKTTRISRDEHKCVKDKELEYFPDYTYSSCNLQNKLVDAGVQCACIPPLLLQYKSVEDGPLDPSFYPPCNLTDHFKCLRGATGPSAYSESQGENFTQTESSYDGVTCHPACITLEFVKSFSQSIFRDDMMIRHLIKNEEANLTQTLKNRYQKALDASALYGLKSPDQVDTPLTRATNAFRKHVVEPSMVPLESNNNNENVARLLLKKHPCVNSFTQTLQTPESEKRRKVRGMMRDLVESEKLADWLAVSCDDGGGEDGGERQAIVRANTFESIQLDRMHRSFERLRKLANQFSSYYDGVQPPIRSRNVSFADGWVEDPDGGCFCNITVFGNVKCFCSIGELERKSIAAFRVVQQFTNTFQDQLFQIREKMIKNDPVPILVFAKIRDELSRLVEWSDDYLAVTKSNYSQYGGIVESLREYGKDDFVSVRMSPSSSQSFVNADLQALYGKLELSECSQVFADMNDYYDKSAIQFDKQPPTELVTNLNRTFERMDQNFINSCKGMGGMQFRNRSLAQRKNYKARLGIMVCDARDKLYKDYIKQNATLQVDKILREIINASMSSEGMQKQQKLVKAIESLKGMDEQLKKYKNEEIPKSQLNTEIKLRKRTFYKAVQNYEGVVGEEIDKLQKMVVNFKNSEIMENYKSNIKNDKSAESAKIKCTLGAEKALEAIRSNLTDEHGYYLTSIMEELFRDLQEYDEEVDQLKQFFKNNMAYVKVYYKSMAIQHTIQSKTYDFWSFLCDTGGTLGLFLGASLLTLFEMVELLCLRSLSALGIKNDFTEGTSGGPHPPKSAVKVARDGSQVPKIPQNNGTTVNSNSKTVSDKHHAGLKRHNGVAPLDRS